MMVVQKMCGTFSFPGGPVVDAIQIKAVNIQLIKSQNTSFTVS